MNRNRGEGGLMILLIVYDREVEVEGMEAHPLFLSATAAAGSVVAPIQQPPLCLVATPVSAIPKQMEPLEHCY